MSESNEQKKLITWFKYQYPGKIIFGIPNGSWLSGDAKRRAMIMRSMKAQGLLPGVSDLFIPEPVRYELFGKNSMTIWYHGLFLEMKDTGKTHCSVSVQQSWFLDKMETRQYKAVWCAGFEEAKQIIIEYFKDR